jgi:hypothetical protein
LRFNYPNDRWNARMSYRVVSKNADPAVGFIERADYRRWNRWCASAAAELSLSGRCR